MNVGWVDGNAECMRQGLIAGTNVAPGVGELDVVVTDKDKYVWDRD